MYVAIHTTCEARCGALHHGQSLA